MKHTAIARKAAQKLLTAGGYSLNKNAGEVKNGYAVADGKNEKIIKSYVNQADLAGAILMYILDNPLKTNEFYGGWLDSSSGLIYLDKSERVENLEEAKTLGKARQQLAIFDLENLETITL